MKVIATKVGKIFCSYFMNSIPSYVSLNILEHIYFKDLFRVSPMISGSSWINFPFVLSVGYY